MRKIFLRMATTQKIRLGVALNLLPLNKSDMVLDAGCSWGASTYYFIKHVNTCVGVDIDYNSLKDGKVILKKYDRKFMPVCANVMSLPLKEGSFDKIISIAVMGILPDDKLFIKEMHRVLKEGGYLVLTVQNSSAPKNVLDITPFVPTLLKRDPTQDGGRVAPVEKRYTTIEITKILTEAGFKIQKHDYAFKGIARIMLDLIYATKLFRFIDVLVYPIAYFDKYCYRKTGHHHVILVKKMVKINKPRKYGVE